MYDKNYLSIDNCKKIKYRGRYKVSNILFYDINGDIIYQLNSDNLCIIEDNEETIKDYYIYFDEKINYLRSCYIDNLFLQNKTDIFIANYNSKIPSMFFSYPQLFLPISKYNPTILESTTKDYNKSVFEKIIEKKFSITFKSSDILLRSIKNTNFVFYIQENRFYTPKGKKLKELKDIIDDYCHSLSINNDYIKLEHIEMIINNLSNKNFLKIFNELLREEKIKSIFNE